jgi:TolB-like protein/thioredoxin-like negative regulator of GroEL
MQSGPGDRLHSWKEIAVYLRRSVRTARRWEAEEGLPVHRHVHQSLATVYASKAEIDAWLENPARARDVKPPAPPRDAGDPGQSIAVLPFENLSSGGENDYFADGLTDEVTTKLSNVRSLRVISRTSSRALRGTNRSARAIAAELGVRHLLEGSVRREGTRLRVSAQLIDAITDDHLWADTYDGSIDDVFAIQERLARVIVQALELRLTPAEELRLTERAIDSVAAYECYLRARHESLRWRKDAIDHAVQLLQNGLSIIGENGRLSAALGLTWLQYREAGIDFSEEPLLEAEKYAARAFAIDGPSAAALQLRGWIHYSRSRVQEAVRDLNAALERDPGNADTLLLLSNCYLISGRVAEARPLIRRLLSIDPLTPLTRCMPAWADILEGHVAAAIAPYRQMLEMDPSNPMARLFYVWVLVLNGRGEAATTVAEAYPVELRDTVAAKIAAFLAYAAKGDLIDLPRDVDEVAAATDLFPRFLAEGFALGGAGDAATHWLAIAVERGFINYPFLAQHDPSFATLRSDARFLRLLEVVHDRWQRFEA